MSTKQKINKLLDILMPIWFVTVLVFILYVTFTFSAHAEEPFCQGYIPETKVSPGRYCDPTTRTNCYIILNGSILGGGSGISCVRW
jgi:hypothetical protein